MKEKIGIKIYLTSDVNSDYDVDRKKTRFFLIPSFQFQLPKLECFSLKTSIYNDLEFAYLKWILNNLNHIRKLKIRLGGHDFSNKETTIWNLLVDAHFIRQYCMPDICKNLINFDFYIVFKCELPRINTEKIINSFKTHSFFIDRQWTNVTCFFDPFMSYQHLSSSIVSKLQFYDDLW